MNIEPDLPIRVLVVQRDIDAAHALLDLLEHDGGFNVLEHWQDIPSAVVLRSRAPELVIVDAFVAEELRVALDAASIEPVSIITGSARHQGGLPSVAVAMFAGGACMELALLRAKLEVQCRRLCELARRLRVCEAGDSPVLVRRFAIRSDDRIISVWPDEIDWIQAAGNYIWLHVGEASYPVRTTMFRMEQSLPPDNFIRVHRKAIVNLDRVLEFQVPPTGNMFAVLRNGKHLPLSRGYEGDLRAFLSRSFGVPCRVAVVGGSEAHEEASTVVRPGIDKFPSRSALIH